MSTTTRMADLNYVAVWFNYGGLPRAEFFATEAEAIIADLKRAAEDYLEDGVLPPNLDDWCVAKVTHTIREHTPPLGDTEIVVEAANAN